MVCKTPPEALVEQLVPVVGGTVPPAALAEAPTSPKATKLFTEPVALWAVIGAQAVAELNMAISCCCQINFIIIIIASTSSLI
jgi:hypothetical protein